MKIATIAVLAVIAITLASAPAGATWFESPLPTPQEAEAAESIVTVAAEYGVILDAYGPLNEVARAYLWAQAQDRRCNTDYVLAYEILADYGFSGVTSVAVVCTPRHVEPEHMGAGLRINDHRPLFVSARRPHVGVGYAMLDGIERVAVISTDGAIPTSGFDGDAEPSSPELTRRTWLPTVTR